MTSVVEEYLTNCNLALREAADVIAEDPSNETLVDQVFGDIYSTYTSVKAFLVADANKRVIDVCPAGNPIITPYIGVTIDDPYFTYSADSRP